ncbi:YoaK family protein [Acetobacter fabarum]|uniref:YoaK family protein n=1 Tax=Acetobacter fabarum TaxID=483199 RepID=UPI00312B5F62
MQHSALWGTVQSRLQPERTTSPEMPDAPATPVAVSARRILVLGILAGHIDALSFAHLGGLFASAMTGNTTHLSAALAHADWHYAVLLAGVLAIFFSAGFLASLVRLRWGAANGIGLIALFLLVVQAAQSGAHARLAELVLLPALMAVQGESIARFSGNAIQTVVITSNMLKCASALASAVALRCGASTGAALPAGAILLPGLSWIGFAGGAMLGALALLWHAPLPFLWPLPWLAILSLDISPHKKPEC